MDDSGASNWTEIRLPLGAVGAQGGKASPCRRSYHSSVVFSEKMYIYGGKDLYDKKLGDVWLYYFDHEYWERCVCQTPPAPRSHHTANIHGDLMYVFGGQMPERICSREMQVLDMNEMRWERKASKGYQPEARDSHAAVNFESRLYIFGGVGASGWAMNDISCFDMGMESYLDKEIQDETTGEPPPARSGHSAVGAGMDILIFGGSDTINRKLQDLWSFDTFNKVWKEIQATGIPPAPRSGHRACVHGNVMLVFGGTGADAADTNDLFHLNLQSYEWKPKQGEIRAFAVIGNYERSQREELERKARKADRSAPRGSAGTGMDGRPRNSKRCVARPAPARSPEDVRLFAALGIGVQGPGGADGASGKASGAKGALGGGGGSGSQTLSGVSGHGGGMPGVERIEGKVPCARDGHSAVVYDGLMFVFGGGKLRTDLNDLFVYKV